MISWVRHIYHYDKQDGTLNTDDNWCYGRPIPAYRRGYSLFSASHLPEKATVFGIGERTQDIYNSGVLNDILEKTVITRTFEEVTGKEIKRLHQVPVRFAPEEFEVYKTVINEFQRIQRNYFASTGNHRKDAMLKLMQQITLLLRVSAAPDTLQEYEGSTPVKILAAVDMAAQWENEIIGIGVRHKAVLDSYVKAFQEYLPDRPLFICTGSTMTFAKRRALRKTLRESGNGILLCTQQSLPSSVNFEFVDKVILRSGGRYICVDVLRDENPVGAVMRRLSDGYVLKAHGLWLTQNGTIHWDYSTGGHWPEGKIKPRISVGEAVSNLKKYQGYEPIDEETGCRKHAFDLNDETVDTLLTAIALLDVYLASDAALDKVHH